MRKLIIFSLFIVWSTCTFAVDCTSGVTVDIVECQNHDYQQADALLSVAYKRAMGSAKSYDKSGALANKLRDAQRAWIKFRDADCEAQRAVYEGGTMGAVVLNGCMLSHVKTRTKDLQEFTSSLE